MRVPGNNHTRAITPGLQQFSQPTTPLMTVEMNGFGIGYLIPRLSPKPRLLYVITNSDFGGAQQHVFSLIDSLQQEYEIHLAVGVSGNLTDKLQAIGIKTYIFPALVRQISPAQDLRAIKQCLKLIHEIQPDLIHAHSSKAGMVARIAGFWAKIPTLFTAHGWGFDDRISLKRRLPVLLIEKILALITTKVICVAESDRQLAIRKKVFPPRKLVTIYNGITTVDPQGLFTNSINSATNVTQPVRLIMVARFNFQQKDQPTLMRALKELGDQRVHLTLAGTGPNLEEGKLLATELGVASAVSFLGDRSDITALLATNHIFILSTHYEGFPISILEAMRAGMPIIATAVNGIPEQIIDGVTGLLVPPEDSMALAQAIKRLAADPALRQRLGQAAQLKFQQEFTSDKMVEITNQLYRTMLPAPALSK
jgi:glycosyltransferase involved in cell wall biosynthesis